MKSFLNACGEIRRISEEDVLPKSTILLSCNSKGLFFDFYLKRKRNKRLVGRTPLPATICQWYFCKLLVGFQQIILKIAL